MVLDRVGGHVELPPLQLVVGTQVDDGADAQVPQDGVVTHGQLAQAVGPEERAPAGDRRARVDHVPTEVAEVHRAIEEDPAFEGVGHDVRAVRRRACPTWETNGSGLVLPEGPTPTMLRMRSSSSVSRRSLEASTGAKG